MAQRWLTRLLSSRETPDAEPLRSRLLHIGKGTFFVLKTYPGEHTATIDTAVTIQKDRLYLSDTGNLKIGDDLTFDNPVDQNKYKDYGMMSLQDLEQSSGHYVSDDTRVISRNLKYILYRTNDAWNLLYNPLHTSQFAALFKKDKLSANDLRWGAPSVRTDRHDNLSGAMRDYCDAMVVDVGDHQSFLDPTCNIVYSKQQCARSAFFSDSRTAYDPTMIAVNDKMLDQFVSGNPPLCVCMGDAHEYVKENAPKSSFIHTFMGMDACNPNITNTVCNVITQAGGDIHMSNSKIQNDCGTGVSHESDGALNDGTELEQVESFDDAYGETDELDDVLEEEEEDIPSLPPPPTSKAAPQGPSPVMVGGAVTIVVLIIALVIMSVRRK